MIICRRVKLYLYLLYCMKVKFKCFKYLNIKFKNIENVKKEKKGK